MSAILIDELNYCIVCPKSCERWARLCDDCSEFFLDPRDSLSLDSCVPHVDLAPSKTTAWRRFLCGINVHGPTKHVPDPAGRNWFDGSYDSCEWCGVRYSDGGEFLGC